MKILDIIYIRYYDSKGEKMTIGGIQTYISHLVNLTSRLNITVRIFQYADISFEKNINDKTKIIGLRIPATKRNADFLYKSVCKTRNKNFTYVTLFATDMLIPSYKVTNSIAIQHGIYWDCEGHKKRSFLRSFLSRTYEAYHIVKRLRNVEEVVCVDHNFICWHRTQLHKRKVKLIPILNFTKIGPIAPPKSTDGKVRIIFARRFFDYRGTRIFAKAAKHLLNENANIEVILAGEGPDEKWLKAELAAYPNVTFTHYHSEESIAFHLKFDIAVIPTTGSEGTSLSLLEAMSAHCAIVCTNVGGMTNIIIDGFNGIMVSPTSESIYEGLNTLVKDNMLRNELAENGFKTVKTAFNLEKWEAKWTKVLKDKI